MKQAIEKLKQETKHNWPSFLNIINSELLTLEENLRGKLSAKSKLLATIVSYIFESGGKRLRPALCFLMAKATGGVNEKHMILAELTELIHTASLVHDDVIDEASVRRGKETVNSLWNDKISVITGDFLFGQASVKLGELENTEIVKIYANVLSDLCDGEIEQYSSLFNTNITWEQYINKSIAKTASLFAAACKSAAIINNQSPEVINKANEYGLSVGIAFQIIDDLLDFTKKMEEIGKEPFSDLKQGIITAPTLYALESPDERAKQIKLLIESRFSVKADLEKAIGLIFELGCCDKAKNLAESYMNKGVTSLSFVKDAEVKNALESMTRYIVSKL